MHLGMSVILGLTFFFFLHFSSIRIFHSMSLPEFSSYRSNLLMVCGYIRVYLF